MQTLREALSDAREKGYALGHFNVATMDMAQGVLEGAARLNVPVVIGLSEGERAFTGSVPAIEYIRAAARDRKVAVFVNADHTYSTARAKEAIDAGFDSIVVDGAQMSFQDNIHLVRDIVAYRNDRGRHTLIEGELGYIGVSSKLLTEIPKGAATGGDTLTSVEQGQQFVSETGVDAFAPAVGSLHGMLEGQRAELQPRLNIERIRALKEALPVPLVLHGGSGTTDEDFKAAIKAGIALIHVSTELRLAYRRALDTALQHDPSELAPYRYFAPAVSAVAGVVERNLRLFMGK